jgi:hypothetical protein
MPMLTFAPEHTLAALLFQAPSGMLWKGVLTILQCLAKAMEFA